jgi:6-phosphogluconolactonase
MTVAARLRCLGSVILFAFQLAVLGGCGSNSGAKFCSGTCVAPTEFVYATELNDISSFSLSAVGIPTLLENQSGPNSSEGIVVDSSGKYLYVSDFANSNVDAFAINVSGGLTGIAGSPFSAGSSVGGIAVDPATKFLYVTLLNTAQVAGFSINSNGALSPISSSPFAAGDTPFQAVVDPTGMFLYVSNLNDSMGGISAYTIDPTSGALTAVAGSPFPTQANFPGPHGLAIGAGGKFLYVGMSGTVNANHVVSAFSIDRATGKLAQLAGSPFPTGNDPQGVATDPSGRFLFTANAVDSTVSAFTIDATSGGLTAVASSPFALQSAPNGLAVDPTGGYLLVASSGNNGLSVFSVTATSGVLSPIAGSPFSTGQGLSGVTVAKPH